MEKKHNSVNLEALSHLNLVNPYNPFNDSRDFLSKDLKTYCSTDTVIAIGSSTGGIKAIETVITHLPKEMPPILIVQHLPKAHTKSLASRLDLLSQVTVKEAEHMEKLKKGYVYIAPGEQHMEISKKKGSYIIALSDGPKVNYHKPSVEVLFVSMAHVVKEKAVGVILTGMGGDGAIGLKMMKDAGAHTIAQDEATSTIFGMPKKAIELGAAKETLPIEHISGRLRHLIEAAHLSPKVTAPVL